MFFIRESKINVKRHTHAGVRMDALEVLCFYWWYKLKTLKEVEIYIIEDKHLAGIPSTQEIAKNS